MSKFPYAAIAAVIFTAALGLPMTTAAVAQSSAAAAAPAAAPEAAKTKAKKPQTAGQIAARERMHKCAAEWKAAKAGGKIEKGMKWPKYWSTCNKRLKSGG